ncbi:MAG: acyltransferase domain-containing protein, partial [Rickettsiales bacterium]|nr:acyltransferase domain-containing protein [Rickettsiales bacterium]
MKRDIAVVGISCYYPGAKNPVEFWQNILSKRQQFRSFPDCRLPLKEYYHPDKLNQDTTYGKKAALIDGFYFDWLNKKIPKSTFINTDIVHWLALDTAIKAIEDSEINFEGTAKERVGVVVGNTLTSEFVRSDSMRLRWPFIKKVLDKSIKKLNLHESEEDELRVEMEKVYKSVFKDFTDDTLAGSLSNVIAGRIANFFDFNGGGYSVDGACSSSLLAIITAANSLVLKDMDLVIVGGVDISIDSFETVGFSRVGALTDGKMKVYDQSGKGFVPGEGCGFVILKRFEDAKKDNNKIYSIIKGWGISSDGKGGITTPKATSQSMALRRAYQRAGITPDKLDFIEGHGTGTSVGDRIELEAIKETFDYFNIKDNKKTCAITSVKSVIGHTKAAAGIGAFIKTVMSLNQKVIPPTAGINVPHSFFKTEKSKIYPALNAIDLSHKNRIFAGVSAMGFGGINSHVILSSFDKARRLVDNEKINHLSFTYQDSELFLFSSTDKKNLIDELKKIKTLSVGMSEAQLLDLSFETTKNVNSKHKIKCSIIAKDVEDLISKLGKAISFIEKSDINNNKALITDDRSIFIGQELSRPKISFLFPGQGSQKINSSRILIKRFKWAKDIVDECDNITAQYGFRVSEYLFRNLELITDQDELQKIEKELSETKIVQPAIVLSTVLWLEFLKKLGISADSVSGHSLGESVSYYESGCYSREDLFRLVAHRGYSMTKTKNKGKMVSLLCNERRARDLIKNIHGIEIANI